MKIVLLTLGTRGDVQPYFVLAQALQAKGHDVVISTGKNFATFASAYGLKFVPVDADFQALINSEAGKEMIKNPFLARKYFSTIVQPMMVEAMQVFYELSKSADCVLFHVKSLADFFADQFPEKMIRANVVPAIEPTSEFPNPVFSGLALPEFLNRFTYKLADLGLSMMHKAVREFRTVSGLSSDIPKRIPLRSVYGISAHILRMPKDYPPNTDFTGFWQGNSVDKLSEEIVQFVNSNKPTVLVTFGSMVFQTSFNLSEALDDAMKKLGIQIIVVKGWGFQDSDQFRSNELIKMIDHAP